MKLSQWIKGAALAAAAALLAPTAQATKYNLAIAGLQVTDANKDDILGDGGSVRFSLAGENGTLTLSNAAITNVLGGYTYDDKLSGIVAVDAFALTIVLEGSNVVKAVPNTGIYANELTITGGGSLWLVPNEGRGIYAEGDLTIDGATVSDIGSRGGGIECLGNLTITNADVTASNRDSHNGIECQRLSIGGASRLEAITAGTGDKVGQKSALWFKNGIEIGDGLVVSEPSPYWIEDHTVHAEGDSGVDGALRVVIGPPVAYPVWVGGVQVTDANAEDVLGDGRVRFEGTEAGGTLALSNAVVTNAVKYDSSLEGTAGIYAGGGFELAISLEGSNRVENAGQYGECIYAKGNLSVGGEGSLTAEGRERVDGICVDGNLRIEGTTVIAKGCGVGICANGSATFDGARRVEATVTDDNVGIAIVANGGITVGGGLNLVEPDGGRLYENFFVDADRNEARYVLLESDTAYDLWVGGVRVTSGNAGDVLGDGRVRFEGTAAGGTLALSNAVVTNAVAYDGGVATAGIYAGDGFELTVSLAGSNRVENAGDEAGRGIRAKGNLTLCGEGSLTVKGGTGADGISADGTLRIEGATVAASGVCGVSGGGNIVLSNATVSATGSIYGICAGRQAAFAGESRVVATATDGEGRAVLAHSGITFGEGLEVVVPVGGGGSSDGTTIVDAAGNTAERVVIAAPGTLLGSGTEADPYVVYDYATLVEFAGAVNGGQTNAWGVIAADIAATEADWVPIGQDDGYNGTFDGAGHVISALANAGTPDYAGLFGFVDSGGVVRNVRLAGVAFNGTIAAGGVAGYNEGTVSNCCVSGSVRGRFNAGGVVGDNCGTVSNCYNTGTVSGGETAAVGGVVGRNYIGTVANCHSTGAVSGGGVVGANAGGTVSNSYCPFSLRVTAIGYDRGTVEECKALTATAYTQTNSFKRWDFTNVWAMGAEGPYLRVLGPTVAYPLWVDGVQVTDVNSGNILGNGSARYAGTMTWGTLMLANAVITNAVAYDSGLAYTAVIYAGNGFDLTISLDGTNRVANAEDFGEGIHAEGNLSLGGAGSLTAEAGKNAEGIVADGNLRIENTTVAASGGTGLNITGNIVLTNATVSATGVAFAIYADGSATFAGESRVEATAIDAAAVLADGGITVGEGLTLVEPDGGGVAGDVFVDAGGNPVGYVLLESSVAYDLWVGGVQVCSTNAGDILGDGSAWFEGTAAGGTLALSNAVVTNAVAYNNLSSAGIYAGDGFDLTISLDGSNQVANAREHGYGILANGNLSLGGAGSLTAEAGRNAEGISAKGNLRIEGTTVAASGVNGVSSGRNIVLTNATVTATGVLDGIYAIGAIAFAGESRVEATATESDGEAIYANDGIALEDGIGVALPVGGRVSEYGTAITDAAGNAAGYAMVARLYSIRVTGGSSTNQVAAAGFSIDITADEPEDGEAFVQWSSNVEGLEFEEAGASQTRFTMPATNVTVEAVFMPIVLTWRDDPAEYPYTGGEIEPPFDVALEGVDLYLGTNYTVSWADNVNVGTATLTVTLTNRPSGVQRNSFRIKPKALDEESVELNLPTVGWCTFDGTALQPGFNIKDPALHESDLVVVWTNNVGPGTASVLFTGTNNYAGRVEKTFEIKWASERVDGTEWSYRTDLGGGTNATVTGASPAEGVLTVPGTLGGVPVAGIGDGAFEGCTNLTGFVMGDGVQDIGEEAFKGCTGLTNVVFGAGIESVGANAFAGCDALETVWVPIGQRGTGLLDAAGLPDGCTVRYYGTQRVTFKPNGGTCATASQEFGIGAVYRGLPVPTRSGCLFDGWWTAKSGGTRVTATSTVTEEPERTLWARWEANTCAVTLDAQGGQGGTARVTATYGKAMPGITPPKRRNRVFAGYFTGKGGTGRRYYTAAGKSAAAWGGAAGGTATLYASWTAKPRAERASYHDPDSAYWDVEFGTPGAALGHGDYAAATGGTNIACTTNSSGARTWWVPGAADPGILQRAVDRARPGDSIKVGPGCYGAVVVGKDRISISSTKGRMRTFVNGEYGARCVDFGSTTGGRISGFTLVQGNAGSGDGGGIRGGSASQCLIEGCRAEHGGGAAMSSLADCLLTWNTASSSGGGAYGGSLLRCEVRHNEAAIGGGAVATRATGTLFAGNEATGKAGGAEQSTLMACTVADNRARTAAGVSGCTVKNSVLHGNRLWSGATNNHSSSTCQYTCAWPVPAGTGNFCLPPNFADPAEENYHLNNFSKCRDRGNGALSATPWDLAGLDRTMGTNTDAGCYEYATEVRPLAPADYDGDGQPDVGFFRPSNGTWFLRQSSDGTVRRVSLGNEKSILVPRDWDGDGVRDPAVYDSDSGTWTMALSSTKGTATKKLGWKGITAVDAADWDGDGAADPIIFNPASKTWQILQSGSGATAVVRDFGWGGIKVFCGDYDGDGLAELGFYSATSCIWYVRGRDGTVRTMKLGAQGAKPCPVDFDMDGALDPCCFLPATGTWTWKSLVTGEKETVKFGDSTITPYPFDWNNDGMPDSLGFYSPYRAGFLDLYRKSDGSKGAHKICF